MSESEHLRATDRSALTPDIRWVDIDPGRGILYYKGFVGNWGLFRIRPMCGDRPSFYISTLLPGMKGIVTSADNLEQAQRMAIRMLEHWLGMLYRDTRPRRSHATAEQQRGKAESCAVLRLVHGPPV